MDNKHLNTFSGKERELEKTKTKTKTAQKEQHKEAESGHVCGNCGHRNEPGAKFCEECGNPLGAFNCKNCGTPYQPGQDLCEKCGASLVENACRFCYAQVEPDDKFCPECGNPTEGIKCGKCGTLSFFDFCPGCNNPLTDAALAEIAKSKNDPQIKKINSLFEEFTLLEEEDEEDAPTQQELMQQSLQEEMELERQKLKEKFEKMKQQFQTFDGGKEEKTKPKPAPEKSKPNVPVFKEKKNRAEREAKKKELLKQIQAEMDKLKDRTFSDPQAARRFFNANRPAGNYVWNCNFNDSVHPDPNNCGNPEKGGHWIILYEDIEWVTHHGEC